MQISRASLSDIDAITTLLVERDGVAPSREHVAKSFFLDGHDGYALVLKEGEEVVAISAFQERKLSGRQGASKQFLYWQDLYVSEAHRDGRAYIMITGHLRKAIREGNLDGVYCVVHRQNVLPMHFSRGFKELKKYVMYFSGIWLSFDRRPKLAAQHGTGQVDALLAQLNGRRTPKHLQAVWTRAQLIDRLRGRMGHAVKMVELDGKIAIYSERRIAPFVHAYFPLTNSGKALPQQLRRMSKPGLCLLFNIKEQKHYEGWEKRVVRDYTLISLSPSGAEEPNIEFEFIEHDAI